MKAERQHKEVITRIIQPSIGGGVHIVDNSPRARDQTKAVDAIQKRESKRALSENSRTKLKGNQGKNGDKGIQLMVDEYAKNPDCFNQMMDHFPYGSIRQALGYRTLAWAFVNNINLGMTFSDKAFGDSDHAEDAVIDTMEIILGFNEKIATESINISAELYRKIRASIDEGKRDLRLEISASPCPRCTQRIIDFARLYKFNIETIFHHYYRDPVGGKDISIKNVGELRGAGITAKLSEDVIQR